MKIALFGNKIATQVILKKLTELNYRPTVYQVSTDQAHNIAGYHEITADSEQHDMKIRLVDNYTLRSQKDLEHFRKEKYDIGICAGWQRLIPQSILDTFQFGIFGWHGSPFHFPNGRGRSPLNWTLRLGLSEIKLYCFKYNSGADEGDIFNCSTIPVDRSSVISKVQQDTLPYILNDVRNLLKECERGKISLRKQTDKAFISFPKLTPLDGELVIGLHTATQFKNIIKATSRPFPGAFLKLENELIRIWNGDLFLRTKASCLRCQQSEVIFHKDTMMIGFENEILVSKDFERRSYEDFG